MKTWLITTSAPFYGTEQYYMAYSEISPCEIQELNDWFWNEETMNLWDAYSYIDSNPQEWQENCNMECSEMSLEELEDYGYNGELPECIYDERNISNNN